MRRVRYNCAMSLDGYIAGPNDEFDWIAIDPDIDFDALFQQFDTYLLGRRTFEVTAGEDFPVPPGSRTFVFSNTLRQSDYAGRHDHRRQLDRGGPVATRGVGQGHLAVRRRRPVSQSSPRKGSSTRWRSRSCRSCSAEAFLSSPSCPHE